MRQEFKIKANQEEIQQPEKDKPMISKLLSQSIKTYK